MLSSPAQALQAHQAVTLWDDGSVKRPTKTYLMLVYAFVRLTDATWPPGTAPSTSLVCRSSAYTYISEMYF